ncbi:hypothetical protein [Verrucosispora sp. WMMD1129]|uniref:hypothetical protein n=1 Tax=Verrucosispora sp. WMMD1129 TaxID=3016093 RepID=UPI00249A6732|nr:hypothetical protein [Verrucosispora sp. WMMD1129]WFE44266.1 hypothetical protein O7624_07920 [Verrucosispora sp. WMMD1129]
MGRELPAIRFRFAEVDREAYGDGWHDFDQEKLNGLRARALMALDDELRAELGLSVVSAVASMLRGEMAGTVGVMWLALHLGGSPVKLADFNPLPMLAEMQLGDPPAEGGDQ